jgi:hypothetical protein
MKNSKKLINNKVFRVSFFIGLFFLALSVLNQRGVINIGPIINRISPCDGTNFPTSIYYYCYSIYDFNLYLISTGIYFTSFLVAIITIIHWLIKNRSK